MPRRGVFNPPLTRVTMPLPPITVTIPPKMVRNMVTIMPLPTALDNSDASNAGAPAVEGLQPKPTSSKKTQRTEDHHFQKGQHSLEGQGSQC